MRRWLVFAYFLFYCTGVATSQNLHVIGLQDISIYHELKNAYRSPNLVEGLVLKKKKYTRIPLKRLEKFKNLKYLDLSKNKIDSIPSEFARLFPNLEVLILHSNKIERLPQTLFTLKKLKYLYLGKNKINYIPSEIENLNQLLWLDLWNNPFLRMPEEIKNLNALKKLDVRYTGLNESEQKKIKKWLPNTDIIFSNTCNCY